MPIVPHLPAAAAPVFELPGIRFTGLAAPSRGATETAVWIVDIATGTPGTVHKLTREEVIVVIYGRAIASLNGRAIELATGDALIVPAHTDFALANPYPDSFRAVAILPIGGEAIQGDASFVPPWAV